MKSEVIFATLIFLLISPIWGAIKDFIIENENDLKRFGLEDTEQHYDDDLDSGWMQDSCGDASAYTHSDYVGNEAGLDYDTSHVDSRLLREIVQQIKNDPRFEHLWQHLSEDNIVVDRKMLTGINQEDASNMYVDMDANFPGGGNYEIE